MSGCGVEPDTQIRTHAGVLSRAIDTDLVLYHPTTDAITHLDAVASHIWRQLATEPTLDELVAELADVYDADPDILRTDASALLTELAQAQLIVTGVILDE